MLKKLNLWLFSLLVFFRLMTTTMMIAAKSAVTPTATPMYTNRSGRRLKSFWLQLHVGLKITTTILLYVLFVNVLKHTLRSKSVSVGRNLHLLVNTPHITSTSTESLNLVHNCIFKQFNHLMNPLLHHLDYGLRKFTNL